MKKLTLALIGGMLAGSCLTATLPAQAQNPTPAARQRAPGVPLAPQPGEVAKLRNEEAGLARGERRRAPDGGMRGGQTMVQADRDLPMPRGVPSIIAPTR